MVCSCHIRVYRIKLDTGSSKGKDDKPRLGEYTSNHLERQSNAQIKSTCLARTSLEITSETTMAERHFFPNKHRRKTASSLHKHRICINISSIRSKPPCNSHRFGRNNHSRNHDSGHISNHTSNLSSSHVSHHGRSYGRSLDSNQSSIRSSSSSHNNSHNNSHNSNCELSMRWLASEKLRTV